MGEVITNMRIVVFNSQKGGSGKTTLCSNVAVEAERAGDGPVYVIDTDPQASLANWHHARKEETPRRVELTHSLAATRAGLEKMGARWCFIDTTPSRGEDMAELIGGADLVIVPVCPSGHDARATGPTVSMIKSLQRPFAFTVNRGKPNTKIFSKTVEFLSRHGEILMIVRDRSAYADTSIEGRVGADVNREAAAEMRAFWSRIKARVEGVECDA
jgi:chromosome partitioning protein